MNMMNGASAQDILASFQSADSQKRIAAAVERNKGPLQETEDLIRRILAGEVIFDWNAARETRVTREGAKISVENCLPHEEERLRSFADAVRGNFTVLCTLTNDEVLVLNQPDIPVKRIERVPYARIVESISDITGIDAYADLARAFKSLIPCKVQKPDDNGTATPLVITLFKTAISKLMVEDQDFAIKFSHALAANA